MNRQRRPRKLVCAGLQVEPGKVPVELNMTSMAFLKVGPCKAEAPPIVSSPGIWPRVHDHFWTRQVAPTSLRALDLNPEALETVRSEPTRVLPGLRF